MLQNYDIISNKDKKVFNYFILIFAYRRKQLLRQISPIYRAKTMTNIRNCYLWLPSKAREEQVNKYLKTPIYAIKLK